MSEIIRINVISRHYDNALARYFGTKRLKS